MLLLTSEQLCNSSGDLQPGQRVLQNWNVAHTYEVLMMMQSAAMLLPAQHDPFASLAQPSCYKPLRGHYYWLGSAWNTGKPSSGHLFPKNINIVFPLIKKLDSKFQVAWLFFKTKQDFFPSECTIVTSNKNTPTGTLHTTQVFLNCLLHLSRMGAFYLVQISVPLVWDSKLIANVSILWFKLIQCKVPVKLPNTEE